MPTIIQKISLHRNFNRLATAGFCLFFFVLLVQGTALAAVNVKWNKDGSITYKGKTYSTIITEAPSTQNGQSHLVMKKDAKASCPSSAIYFAKGVDLADAKTATYFVQKGNDLGCIPTASTKLQITNKRAAGSAPTGDPLTDGISEDGTTDAAAQINTRSTDPALNFKSSPCKDASHCNLTTKYINPFINFLAVLAMIAVIIGIVWGAIEYVTSGGDAQRVANGKDKIQKALIGLVSFVFLYAFLQWLIPGGLV